MVGVGGVGMALVVVEWMWERDLCLSGMRFFENGLDIRVEGVAFDKSVDHFMHVVEPFWAVVALIPPLHFSHCLPDLGVE